MNPFFSGFSPLCTEPIHLITADPLPVPGFPPPLTVFLCGSMIHFTPEQPVGVFPPFLYGVNKGASLWDDGTVSPATVHDAQWLPVLTSEAQGSIFPQ